MGGVYNTYLDDGVVLDEKRRCDVFAVDFLAQGYRSIQRNHFSMQCLFWSNKTLKGSRRRVCGLRNLGAGPFSFVLAAEARH